MPFNNPLTDQHAAALDKVLESTQPALDLAKACKDCGWDVSDLEAQIQAQHAMATKAKHHFFPHRS